MSPYKRCLLLLVDGARPDVFRELCEKGELPYCDQLFRRGGRFAEATTVFPSTTGPAYLPFLTGNYPGTCNIPGIRWFDKKVYGRGSPRFKRHRSYVSFEILWMGQDLSLNTPFLFENFKKPVNIFNPIYRGGGFQSKKTRQSRIWYWYYAHLTDRWSWVDQIASQKLLNALEQDCDLAFVVFPAIDVYSHLSHPRHEKTLAAYKNVDQSLGKIIQQLDRKGCLNDTLIFLVSDHGLSATQNHFGVASFLEQRGIKTFYYPKIFKRNFEAVTMVSGNGMLHLYFKDPKDKTSFKGWHARTPFEDLESERKDLLQELLEHPGVDILAGEASDGSVVICSKRGKSKIKKMGDQFFYQVISKDPFAYPLLPAQMSEREALELTFRTDYPDALVQLFQIFSASRTGDVVISASKGWDLRKRHESPEHHSSHGSLIQEHMHVPFFSNAPLPSHPSRTVDVFPTLLKLMGKDLPQGIDGVSLI